MVNLQAVRGGAELALQAAEVCGLMDALLALEDEQLAGLVLRPVAE
jgi:hypothetical protein